ncbi:MAG: hypothetical protein AB7O66_17570 [Limisphaerales bacterium]
MKHWKVILAASLIFVTGAATGALAFRAATKVSRAPHEPGGPPPMMDRRFDFLGRLKADLKLTEAQASKIDNVLQEGSKRTRQLWDTVQPQMREEMKRVSERIRAELTPEQQVLFDENSKKFRERRGPRGSGTNSSGDTFRRGGPRGPRPDGPPHSAATHSDSGSNSDSNSNSNSAAPSPGPEPGPDPGPPPPRE